MATPTAQTVARVALGLSLLTFGLYFLNVLLGGPLGHKPWLSDVGEMLTLLLAVTLFVAGTLAREAADRTDSQADSRSGGHRPDPLN